MATYHSFGDLIELQRERENCPYCDCKNSKVVFKSIRKTHKSRYYKKLECLDCEFQWVAESNSEFKQRIEPLEDEGS